MARVNLSTSRYRYIWTPPPEKAPIFTHQGAPAVHISKAQELARTVMACMLWEDTFYESGDSIANRIAKLVPIVEPSVVAALAVEARSNMNLRHAPLMLVREMAKHKSHRPFVRETLTRVIQRADELAEFLALYWLGGKTPIANSVKKGLADAFQKFNAYQLGKYNRDNDIKLRDVLFLCHAKPKDKEQAQVWKQLIDGTLESPDTWEVELSAGGGKFKKESWERLLTESKLGALALIRNLRNMIQAGVDDNMIRRELQNMKTERVLPFRFLAAVRHAPRFAAELEAAMLRNLDGQPKMKGQRCSPVSCVKRFLLPVSRPIQGRSQCTGDWPWQRLSISHSRITRRIWAMRFDGPTRGAMTASSLLRMSRAASRSPTQLGRAT